MPPVQNDISSPLATTTGQPIKYTVEHFCKEGVEVEAFMEWFQKIHLPAALPLMKKHGILNYSVQVRDPKVGNAFQLEVDKVRPGWVVSTCEMVLEYWMYDLESLKSLIMDPEWQEKAVKGEDQWLDLSKATIHIGYNTTYLEGGEITNPGQQ